jgi:predicted amidohydrolase YtcJ
MINPEVVMRHCCSLSLLTLILVSFACGPGVEPEPADLVMIGGTIVTMVDEGDEVEALAARDQRIVATGSEKKIWPYIGPETVVVDLDGDVAYPGFIEAHAHFVGIGRARMQLDLRPARTWDDIVAMVEAAAAQTPAGAWIEGRGWHQEKWTTPPEPSVDGLPIHDALSAVSPDHPVVLTHASGHAAMVNQAALEIAGITETTPDPDGGEIVRDASGRPIGVLRENAEALVLRHRPAGDADAMIVRAVQLASEECLAKGITSFHDAGTRLDQLPLLQRLADDGRLGVRLYVMLTDSAEDLAPHLDEVRRIGSADGFLTVRAIKRWIDGALGAHGAWLLEPYDDLPQSSGLNTEDLDEMRATAEVAAKHGFQLCVHAIGDRANRETLDLYERAFEDREGLRQARWRIEHAQHLHPDDIPRFGALGVIASMQPVHCTSDGPWVPQRLGERRAAEGAYVWRSLLDSGAVIATGTDAPVEDVDPLASFRAAITRRMADGTAFHPEQRMSRHEALRSMTRDAAYAAFEEGEKGTLEVGRLADVTVLSGDLRTMPEETLGDVAVTTTIVGGRVAFSR